MDSGYADEITCLELKIPNVLLECPCCCRNPESMFCFNQMFVEAKSPRDYYHLSSVNPQFRLIRLYKQTK